MSQSSFNPATVAAEEDGGGAGTGPWVNVLDYGAVGDAETVNTAAITAGTNSVNISPGTFTADDVGKVCYIRRAGAVETTNTGVVNGTLYAVITAVAGSVATLNTNAIATVSGQRIDWGTDNYGAFAAAAAAIPLATGGTLYAPAGAYLFGTNYFAWPLEWQVINLRNRDNIMVRGEGIGVTTFLYLSHPIANNSWGGNCILMGNTNKAYFNRAVYDLTIRDLNYGAAINVSNPSGIQAVFVNKVRIERVEFINCKGNGALNIVGTRDGSQNPINYDAYVIDCIFSGDSAGRWIEGDGMNIGNYYNVHVRRNRISGVLRQGLEGGGNNHDWWIDSNYVDMMSQGNSAINPTGCSKITVSNNKIVNATTGGIDFSTDVSATGFLLRDIRVTGNYCHGSYGVKFQNTSGGGTQGQIDRLRVDNNYFPGGSGVVIYLPYDQVPNAIIENNRFGGGGPAAIMPVPTDAVAIPASGVRVIVRNNHVEGINRVLLPFDPGATGFKNWRGSPAVIIEGNTFGSGMADAGNGSNYGGAKLVSWTGAPGNLAAGGGLTFPTVTVHGANITDTVEICIDTSIWNQQLIYWGNVSAANTVQIFAYNPTAGAIFYPQNSFRVIVHRRI